MVYQTMIEGSSQSDSESTTSPPIDEFPCSPSEYSLLISKGLEVSSKIGEGVFSKVIKCFHLTSDNKPEALACKIIDANKASKIFVKKFLPRELEILRRIHHPNIVQVWGIFQCNKKYFILMHPEENDLLKYIRKNGPVPETGAKFWTWQIARALKYLHDLGLIHRDIKCENVLISKNLNAKLCDFGFARQVYEHGSLKCPCLTVCGSVAYSCPEILRGFPYDGKLADSYSLGIVLFAMLNRKLPYKEKALNVFVQLQRTLKYTYNEKILGCITTDVQRVVRKLLHPDPRKRWRIEDLLTSSWIASESWWAGAESLNSSREEKSSSPSESQSSTPPSVTLCSQNSTSIPDI